MEIKMLGMIIKTNDTMRIVMILIFIIGLSSLYGQTNENDKLKETIEKAFGGDSYSQSELIYYYYNKAKDYKEAIKWCNNLVANQIAKDSDREYANRILGYCAFKGNGLEKSIDDAISYWKRGAEYKGGSCALALAQVYASQLKDSVESIIWYKQAAELENKTAAYYLANLYENGFVLTQEDIIKYYPNVVKDIFQASKYYEIYIKNMGYRWSGVPTNSKLLYKLALWYYSGEGSLEKNYSRAFFLFNSSVESNENSNEEYKLSSEEEGNALWCISVCYRFGRGVDKDELMARRYVKRAADKGNVNALSLLGE